MRVGDIVVYKIDPNCEQSDNRADTGHIMFVLEHNKNPSGECQKGDVTYVRYKLKIADASKKSHFGDGSKKDSRDACRNSGRWDATPPNLGCGIGSGWVYAWALKCTKSDWSKCVQTIQAMQMFQNSTATPKCPPKRNLQCHKYRVGRITARR
jgi:hypothetical protein